LLRTGTHSPREAANLEYKRLMSKPAPPVRSGLDTMSAPRSTSHGTTRLPLSPTKLSSPRKLKQRSQTSVPLTEKRQHSTADSPTKPTIQQLGALSPSRSLEPLDSTDAVMISPSKKLVRRASSHRLRKDSGTAGHSRSLSLSRLPREATSVRTVSRSDEDDAPVSMTNWLKQDPTESNFGSPRTDFPPSAQRPRRKPSLYRRLRNQTGTEKEEPSGFPMPSPMTEVARSTPGATVQKAAKGSNSTGLLSTLSRKLSHSNLAAPQTNEPPPLPANFDYFSSTTQTFVPSNTVFATVSPAVSTRRPKHKMPPPVLLDFRDPFKAGESSVAELDGSPMRSPRREVRSKSEPTKYDGALASSSGVQRDPTPRLLSSETVVALEEGSKWEVCLASRAEVLSKVPLDRGSARHARAFTSPSPPPRDRNEDAGASTTKRTVDVSFGIGSQSQSGTSKVSSNKPLVRPLLPPGSGRSDHAHATMKGTSVPVASLETKFLELLSKSDSSTEGVIKLSLTSQVARDVFS
jgi:hypothetical protein